MSKKIMLAMCAFALPVIGFAQTSPYFGVRLSFDVMHPSGSNGDVNNGSGFTVSGIYNLPLSSRVYLEPGVGVFYNTMGIKPVEYEGELYDGSIRNVGLRVPVNVGYRVQVFDNLEISAYTGPWFNFNISSNARLQPNFESPAPTKTTNLFDYGWHRFDVQWGFGITATYAQHYYLSFNGGVGLSSMATFSTPEHKDKMRRNTFSITLGYNF